MDPSVTPNSHARPPGSSVHGILQAKILECAVMPSSRGSSRPRDRPRVSCVGRQNLYCCTTWGAPSLKAPGRSLSGRMDTHHPRIRGEVWLSFRAEFTVFSTLPPTPWDECANQGPPDILTFPFPITNPAGNGWLLSGAGEGWWVKLAVVLHASGIYSGRLSFVSKNSNTY